MRGYISSTGMVACPHPNVWTHRSACIESAIRVAAFSIAGICVASMSSRMLRVAVSQRLLRDVMQSISRAACAEEFQEELREQEVRSALSGKNRASRRYRQAHRQAMEAACHRIAPSRSRD